MRKFYKIFIPEIFQFIIIRYTFASKYKINPIDCYISKFNITFYI